jgi:hypothetical protein
MSLTPELEALLGKITDPTKREGLRKDLETGSLQEFGKEVASGYLRQSEFSRKMNEISEADKVRASAYTEGLKWTNENRANYAEAMKQRDAAIAKAAELERAASSLESKITPPAQSLEDINMDDSAAVAKAIREARAAADSARSDAALLAQKVTRIDQMLASGELLTTQQFNDEGGKRLESFSRATMDVMETISRGKSEFGMDINRDALLKEASNYNGDLGKAYENLTATARLDKIKAELRNDITKELEAKYQATAGNPLASGEPPMMGPLQQMVYQRQNPESTIDPNIPADGSGRLAHAIAAELRAEGKF